MFIRLGVRERPDPREPFPLKVSPNGRYLVTQQDAPFFIHGQTVWELTHNLTLAEAETALDNIAAKGFNSIIVDVPSTFNESGAAAFPPANDKQGNQPFTGSPMDLTLPIEAFWAHVDDVFAYAKSLELCIFFWPLYLGYDDTQGFRTILASNGTTKCQTYGEWLGTRYGYLNNLVWIHGGDVAPGTWASYIRAIQDGIKVTAPGFLHGTHWGPDASPWDYTADFAESRIDIHGSYTYNPIGTMVNDHYNHSPTKPVFLLETNYEGEAIDGPEARKEPYRAVFSGAIAGHFLGNNPLWFCGDTGGGWAAALDSIAATSLQYLPSLIMSRAWWLLAPSRDDTFTTAGHGNPDLDTGCQAALASDATFGMIFFPSSLTVTVALSKVNALTNVLCRWFKIADGTYSTDGTYAATGTRDFTPPDASHYVLVLEAV